MKKTEDKDFLDNEFRWICFHDFVGNMIKLFEGLGKDISTEQFLTMQTLALWIGICIGRGTNASFLTLSRIAEVIECLGYNRKDDESALDFLKRWNEQQFGAWMRPSQAWLPTNIRSLLDNKK